MRLFFVIVSVFVGASCAKHDNYNDSKLVFRYNESAGIPSLDPAFAKDQARIWFCNQMYNSLIQLDSNLIARPSLAKSWTVSNDGLQYDFILREGVRFHNSEHLFGTKKYRNLGVNDVIYSLNRLRDKRIASPGAWVMSSVKRISSLNDSTVRIDMLTANPTFLGLLSMQYCSILPIESDTVTDFFEAPVGTGPFHFQYHKPNVKLVLRKNENYFEFDGASRLPYIDAVAVSFIADKQTAFLEFINLSKFLCNGILHNFSSTFSPALINSLDSLSLLENRPAYSDPKETIIAPVKVAKSIMNLGLNFFSVNVIASAKTNLPSASVFRISIVFPL